METVKKETLVSKVEGYKLIARDALRMSLIAPRLTKIANLESELVNNSKETTDLTHKILVLNYEISKLDKDHPDYAETKAAMDAIVIDTTPHFDCLKSNEKDINDTIKEQKDGIVNIESGATKVSIDALNDLVAEMINADALASVKA